MSTAYPTPSTATVTRRLEWVDTDASGHHHNGMIMRLVESAEAELMSQAGILSEYFSSAPRVRQEIDFSGMLYFGQQVSATIVVEKMGRSSITLSFDVWGETWDESPRRLVASGKVIAAHVPPFAKRSEPWIDAIVQALTPRTPRT
ncbi:MAG: acyl-CoA thioesterase [Propionibacteriaceae bacterium]|nr:acyl-CoA thioesterase [Propionibacteriaceae bacterium]